MRDIGNSADVIDVRDIISRVEELEVECETERDDSETDEALDLRAELATLTGLLADLAGDGGDEQWRGDWYPLTLVRDSCFKEYAQETAEECGMLKPDTYWPYNCIDWEKAARELRMDYSAVEFDGVTYWYR